MLKEFDLKGEFFLVLVTLQCIFYLGNAQTTYNINFNAKVSNGQSKDFLPPSPNAASLGVYGQIPVGNYTGTPQVSVPLYGIEYKDLTVPLSLIYSSSGNKPDQFPGPVGLGWALQAGGTITRIVKGAPDYEVADASGTFLVPTVYNPTAKPTWSSDSSISQDLKNGFATPEDKNNPDEYYYNLNGISGKFYLHHSGIFKVRSADGHYFNVQIQVETGKKIKVPVLSQSYTEPFPANGYKDTLIKELMIYKFTMTDGLGRKYTFGGTDESIEFSRPGINTLDVSAANISRRIAPTTWNLTSIESPNHYKIVFHYKQGYTVTKFMYNDVQAFNWQNTNGNVPLSGRQFARVNIQKSTLMNVSYLTSIVSPVDSVVFITSTADQQLLYTRDGWIDSLPYFATHPGIYQTVNENNFSLYKDIFYTNTQDLVPEKYKNIRVFDKHGNICKTVFLDYTTSVNTRLKLTDVFVGGKEKPESLPGFRNVNGFQHYLFDYDTLPLPAYLSGQTDHYGYYNGKTPYSPYRINISSDSLMQSRMPDTAYMQAEILKKITYPTGGFTTFEYEPNTYRSIARGWPFSITNDTTNKITSGVRIKTVTGFTDPGKTASVKKYFYTKNYKDAGEESSGVLAYQPIYYENYVDKPVTPPIRYAGSPENYTGTLSLTHWSTNPVFPMGTTRGNHVVYSEVTEVNEDSSFTVYRYKNYDNGFNDKMPVNQRSDNTDVKNFWEEEDGISMDIERGQLLSEELYNAAKEIKQKNVFEYNDDTSRFNNNVRVLAYAENNMPFHSYREVANLIYSYFPFLKRIKSYEYEGTDSLLTTTSFQYNENYNTLTRQSVNTSEGRILSTIKRYPFDLIGQADSSIYKSMINKGMVQTMVEEEQQSDSTILGKNMISFSKSVSSDTSLILPSVLKTQFRNYAAEDRTRLLVYDSSGCLLSSAVVHGDTTCFVWSYAGNYPIAKIAHAGYNAVKAALGGQATIDSFARTMPSDTAINNFEVSLRSYPGLADARITSYTYAPLIGMTSETDVNGIATYYDYDHMGRLIHVRDHNRKILKKICYNFAGQQVDCSSGNVAKMGMVFSSILSDICDRDTTMSIANEFVYHAIDEDSDSLTNIENHWYSDPQLTNPLPTGYYMDANQFFSSHGFKFYYYVLNGRMLYSVPCGSTPPYLLMFADTLTIKDSICQSNFPLVAVSAETEDGLIVGQHLVKPGLNLENDTLQNGTYKINDSMYLKLVGGIITEISSCAPPSPPYQTVDLNYASSPFGCPFLLPFTYYYADLLMVGTTLYYDDDLTMTVGPDLYSDGIYKYTVDFDGMITAVDNCF